jgi:hypothetical protein
MLAAATLTLLAAAGSWRTAAGQEVTTAAISGGGRPVTARCDAAGTIHVLCETRGGPQYVRSADGGRSFAAPKSMVDDASRQPALEFHVWDLAVAKDGAVHVALGTNAWKLKLPKEEWGLFYTRLLPGASEFEPLRNINRIPSEGFSLAADDKGNVTACWLAGKLFANVSHDGGRTFGPNVEIDPSLDPCDCCTTSCAYAADGRLAVLYREETNNERDMYLVLWDQAKNRATRTRISTTPWKIDACPMTYYSIVPAGDGFLAAWPTEGRVYLARLDTAGKLQPPLEIKTPGENGMRTGVTALAGPDGSFLIAWKKANRLGWQLYDTKGQPAGRPGSADSQGSGAAGVVTKDGRFVLFP